MSEDLRQLEERINSRFDLQFDLYNQGMTLLRDTMTRQLGEQERRMLLALAAQRQVMQRALASQRHILDETLLHHQQLVLGFQGEARTAVGEVVAWLGSLEKRIAAVERKLAG